MSSMERSALIRFHLESSGLDFDKFSSEELHILFNQASFNPWELHQLFDRIKKGQSLTEIWRIIQANAGDYASLEFFFEPFSCEQQILFEALALRGDPSNIQELTDMYATLSKEEANSERCSQMLKELVARGFIEGDDESCFILPFIADFVLNNWTRRMSDDARNQRHQNLGERFSSIANNLQQQLKSQIDSGSTESTASLKDSILEHLSKSLFHLLQQDDLSIAFAATEQFGNYSLGRVPTSVAVSFARQLRAKAESQWNALDTEKQSLTDSAQTLGLSLATSSGILLTHRAFSGALEGYQRALQLFLNQEELGHFVGTTSHQIGRVYQEQREWENALENYRQAVEWKKKTGMLHEIPSTYGQMTLLFEEAEDWEAMVDSYLYTLETTFQTNQPEMFVETVINIGRRLLQSDAVPESAKSALRKALGI